MYPSGRFVHGSMAAGKPCPKDARYFMNFINFRSWKLNFMNRAKSVLTRLPCIPKVFPRLYHLYTVTGNLLPAYIAIRERRYKRVITPLEAPWGIITTG